MTIPQNIDLGNMKFSHYNNISNNNFGTIVNYNLNSSDFQASFKKAGINNQGTSPLQGTSQSSNYGIYSSLYGNPHPRFNPLESPGLYLNNYTGPISLKGESLIQSHYSLGSNKPLDQVVKVEVEENQINLQDKSMNFNLINRNHLSFKNYSHRHERELTNNNVDQSNLEDGQNITSLIKMINKHKETNRKPKSSDEFFESSKFI